MIIEKERYYTLKEVVDEGKMTLKQIRSRITKYLEKSPNTKLIKKEGNSYLVARKMLDNLYAKLSTNIAYTFHTPFLTTQRDVLDESIRHLFDLSEITTLTYSIEIDDKHLHVHGSVLIAERKQFETWVTDIFFEKPYYKTQFYTRGWNQYINKESYATILTKSGIKTSSATTTLENKDNELDRLKMALKSIQ